MKREDLLKLAEKHQAKADEAFRNYQETGMTRYDSTRRREEDLADALRMAANAADEHNAYIHMKGELVEYAYRAQAITTRQDWTEEEKRAKADVLVKDLAAFGRLLGLIRKE